MSDELPSCLVLYDNHVKRSIESIIQWRVKGERIISWDQSIAWWCKIDITKTSGFKFLLICYVKFRSPVYLSKRRNFVKPKICDWMSLNLLSQWMDLIYIIFLLKPHRKEGYCYPFLNNLGESITVTFIWMQHGKSCLSHKCTQAENQLKCH